MSSLASMLGLSKDQDFTLVNDKTQTLVMAKEWGKFSEMKTLGVIASPKVKPSICKVCAAKQTIKSNSDA